ncbi:protein extra-macrochaetae-like [Watersipora subatra]|uniref:protein extra-macrochaetae-like n=1 Tax=Watersipora subatra TaxID=2589382 RepID=UPI00355B4AEF
MKANMDFAGRRGGVDLARLQPESFKIKKISHQENKMQELYFKLKELVPACSDKNQMSKTELLQNVIDYIFDLQDTLELDSDESKPPLTESYQSNKMDLEADCEDELRKV